MPVVTGIANLCDVTLTARLQAGPVIPRIESSKLLESVPRDYCLGRHSQLPAGSRHLHASGLTRKVSNLACSVWV
jgi:hypothetical protein